MKHRDTPTAIRRKATVSKLRFKRKTRSILFLLSLLGNVYAIQRIIVFNNQLKTTVIIKDSEEAQKSMVEKIYNLNNYKSVSKFSATAQDRYDKLIKAYNDDIQTTKEKRYTANGNIKADWSRYCKDRVRRIVNLQSRVYDLETVLDNTFSGVDNSQMTDAIKAKGYEDKLSELSNYYAGFLDEYSYNIIVQTTD